MHSCVNISSPLGLVKSRKSWRAQTFCSNNHTHTHEHILVWFWDAYRFSSVHYDHYEWSFIILRTHTIQRLDDCSLRLSSGQSCTPNGINVRTGRVHLKTCTIIIHYGIWTLSTWNQQSGFCTLWCYLLVLVAMCHTEKMAIIKCARRNECICL